MIDEQYIEKFLKEAGAVKRRSANGTKKNEVVNGFTLSDEQQDALNKIKSFINSSFSAKKNMLSLSGNAGTGKSLILSAVVKFAMGKFLKYKLCAPTHKAKYIMSRYTKQEASTIHSLLKLSPKLDIENLDYNDLQFVEPSFLSNSYDLVIIDECSMINEALFDVFNEISLASSIKIIFVGDDKQLRPVKDSTISPTFVKSPIKVRLTKVFRQDNESALVPVLIEARDHVINHFESKKSEKGSLFVTNNPKDFIKPYINILRNCNGDMDAAKIVCYRNERVNSFNNLVRRCLYKDMEKIPPFMNGDFLVGYSNFEYNGYNFFNSSDYRVCEDPKEISISIPFVGITKAFMLTVYDPVFDCTASVPVINVCSENSEFIMKWQTTFESLRIEAIKEKNLKKRNDIWKMYFDCINACVTNTDLSLEGRVVKKRGFNYGYAITCHKSQGSTYTNVFVDMSDIFFVKDEDELRQMQYVSLSRTRTDAYILI